jgi:phosphate transport system substrate-binding protein
MKSRLAVLSVIAGLGLALSAHAEKEIKGSGATFPSLVYTTWAFGYAKEKGVAVKYSPTGSGEGIRTISAREVDFGATDSPLSDTELKKQNLLQFPTIAGAIVPVVNLPGISNGQLKLTGAALADVYAGKIKSWDDSRIAALNPGVRLPNLKITRVVREESSGTTEAFTSYLASASPEWSGGSGKKITWAGEVAALKGNDGVAQAVKETAGAIGYVSLDRVSKHSLTSVSLRNKSGKFVAASENAIVAAVRASDLRKDLHASLLDGAGAESWPIVDVTYILIDAHPKSASEASRTLQFFYWAMLKGDDIVRGTGFAPLPAEVQARVIRQLAEVSPQDGMPVQLIIMMNRVKATIATAQATGSAG